MLELLKRPARSHTPRDELAARLQQMRERHVVTRDIFDEVDKRAQVVNGFDLRFGLPRSPGLTEQRLANMVRAIQACYRDLHRAGSAIEIVDRLAGRHVQVMVRRWQTEIARSTAAERYAALEWWCTRALDKPGMLKPFDLVWPAPVAAPEETQAAAPRRKRASSHLSPMALAGVAERDERGALLLQARQAFGLTTVEVSTLQPWLALRIEGVLVVSDASGRTVKTCAIDSPERHAAAVALKGWGAKHPGQLAWPGLSDMQVRNKLTYLAGLGRKDANESNGDSDEQKAEQAA